MRILQFLIFTIILGCTSNSPAQTVYTTKTGEKYHTATCRYLKYSKKEITLEQAIDLGYQACSVCKPSSGPGQVQSFVSRPSQGTTPQETSSHKTTASQCTGKTKAGNRCKRMTKDASGRCYQHS
ncbi:hypothetical protein POV26_12150 [Aequorivita todarodis]|uniref:hypothetical protein n=1 Tax=Aequorivita todarodis TaxID=2036821 RepID=UPI0023500AB0|nr:hypothetical protein [Aequorivita todarodis]MDC8001791.1 hypothetical protein [Aequorivita todarodis]